MDVVPGPKAGMLVVTRRRRQGVRLVLEDGRLIDLHVLLLRSNDVRLGIDAPRSITIRRIEVLSETEGGSE